MTSLDISAKTKSETKRELELTLDELESVSGGTRKSAGHSASGHMYLVFNFKLVAVKTI